MSKVTTVRICVCGEEGSNKWGLISSFVKGTPDRPPPTAPGAAHPVVTVPPTDGVAHPVRTVIVDTSPSRADRQALADELQRANVILLVYGDDFGLELIRSFWMPHFRGQGVNVPVVVAATGGSGGGDGGGGSGSGANGGVSGGGGGSGSAGGAGRGRGGAGSGGTGAGTTVGRAQVEEPAQLMGEFREIEACIVADVERGINVRETIFLCQKAVLHPASPLFTYLDEPSWGGAETTAITSSGAGGGRAIKALKPDAEAALRRIFSLSDRDKDGVLDADEFRTLQRECFGKEISDAEVDSIRAAVKERSARGISEQGFLRLCLLFIDRGRHETVWQILRRFGYSDSLTLSDSFLRPAFVVPANRSAELSPAGYHFLVRLFVLFDTDKDGRLSEADWTRLFEHSPGLPPVWLAAGFPLCTAESDGGRSVTLPGWLAAWSMTTLASPGTTLEYLGHLGFDTVSGRPLVGGVKLAKGPDREVFEVLVLGAPGSGKSALLDAFLGRPFSPAYTPTAGPRLAVNSVELDGKQVYLILREDSLVLPSSASSPETGGPAGPSAVGVGGGGGGGAGDGGGGGGSAGDGPAGHAPSGADRFRSSFLSPLSSLAGAGWSSRAGPASPPAPSAAAGAGGTGPGEGPVGANGGGAGGGAGGAGTGGGGGASGAGSRPDLVCYVYDSSSATSFAHIAQLRQRHAAQLDRLPSVFVALKADLDTARQRFEPGPGEYTRRLGLAAPTHFSVRWGAAESELFVKLAGLAADPASAAAARPGEPDRRGGWLQALAEEARAGAGVNGLVVAAVLLAGAVLGWRRGGGWLW